jgi:hypothetical protein
MRTETTAIAIRNDFLLPSTIENDYDPEEFEGVVPQFQTIRMPAQGGSKFQISNPLDPDDPIEEKNFAGIIVGSHKANGYWPNPNSRGEAPACSSMDAITGHGNPGGVCAECPYNEFDSHPNGGGGKACKNMRVLYVLRSGDIAPLRFSLPPTAMQGYDKYASNLRLAGLAPSAVVTEIALKKITTKSGNEISTPQFRAAEKLAPELKAQSREYAVSIRALIKQRQAEFGSIGSAASTIGAVVEGEDGSLPF